MYYEFTNFQELIETMYSCDRLGLFYIVQKDTQVVEKWYGKKVEQTVYRLQVVEYIEEVEELEKGEKVSHRRPSESEESPAG